MIDVIKEPCECEEHYTVTSSRLINLPERYVRSTIKLIEYVLENSSITVKHYYVDRIIHDFEFKETNVVYTFEFCFENETDATLALSIIDGVIDTHPHARRYKE